MAAPRLTASRTAPRAAWDWSPTAFWGAAVAREQPHWVSPHFLAAVPSKAEDTLGCELHSVPHSFPDPLCSLPPLQGSPAQCLASRAYGPPQFELEGWLGA